jgi:hypothetical protein
VVGWIWVVAKKEKSKNLERHSSFIIRVVNFMTGWIPDSPPPSPLSYFSLFHFFFLHYQPIFFFISVFCCCFVVPFLDVHILFSLPFDRWFSVIHLVSLRIAIQTRSKNFSVSKFRN